MANNALIQTGKKAPAFTLPDASEANLSLNDMKGKWVVLYFYPKDDTSGCTTEAIDFTARKDDFKKLNTEIVGISPDSCKSHNKFILKHHLGITLLSDEEKKVLDKYGVWQTKKMYGKEYMGVVRTTYLINPEGKIAHVWEKVKVNGHADEVLETVQKHQKA